MIHSTSVKVLFFHSGKSKYELTRNRIFYADGFVSIVMLVSTINLTLPTSALLKSMQLSLFHFCKVALKHLI